MLPGNAELPLYNGALLFAGHYYNRIWVITCGCLLWGVMTVAFSQCNSVMQGYIFWGEVSRSIGQLSETHQRPGNLAAVHWSKHGASVHYLSPDGGMACTFSM